jgi:transposase InsO family protein
MHKLERVFACRAPDAGASKKHSGHEIHPYLLRGLNINRANQVWALDTTYIPMAKAFVYRTDVVDWPRGVYWQQR